MARKAGNPNWVSGISGNSKGRAKGSKNKTTEQIREYLQEIYSNHLERLNHDLEEMNAFQRQQILDKLAAKFIPNLNSNTNSDTVNGAIEIIVKYADDNEISLD